MQICIIFFEETIHARNVIEESGESCFSVQEISDIRNTYNNVLQTAEIQHTHEKTIKAKSGTGIKMKLHLSIDFNVLVRITFFG